jgi:Flp pilus assembly protein TadD
MAPYHINIGVAHQQRGRPDKAEAAYRDAIRIDPAFAPAYVNLADLYRERKRDDEGEKVLRDGLAVSPKSADLHHALGLLQARQRLYTDAIAELGKASSLAPGNPRYAYVYAIALDSAGKPDAALRVLGEAYRRHPYDREILLGLASILRDQGRAKEATRYAEELVAVMPEDAEAKRLLEECARSLVRTVGKGAMRRRVVYPCAGGGPGAAGGRGSSASGNSRWYSSRTNRSTVRISGPMISPMSP